jgi:hypothetical protein
VSPADLLPGMPEPQGPETRTLTEREMLDLLHLRFGFTSQNGGSAKPRYVKAEHVRATTGFFDRGAASARTADFIAVDTWQSGKCAIHGVEVKVSRSDWQRELKDPAKAAAFMNWCTHWWLAVPDRAIVREGELPHGWGFLAAKKHGDGLRLVQIVAAPRRSVPLIPAESMTSLMYAIAKTAATRGTT